MVGPREGHAVLALVPGIARMLPRRMHPNLNLTGIGFPPAPAMAVVVHAAQPAADLWRATTRHGPHRAAVSVEA